MQETMKDGRCQHTDGSQKNDSRIDGIKGCEELPGIRLERIYRSHAAEDHGGIEQGIDPRKVFEKVVAQHADHQGEYKQQQSNQSVEDNTLGKYFLLASGCLWCSYMQPPLYFQSQNRRAGPGNDQKSTLKIRSPVGFSLPPAGSTVTPTPVKSTRLCFG